jgi:hypothetical protein
MNDNPPETKFAIICIVLSIIALIIVNIMPYMWH